MTRMSCHYFSFFSRCKPAQKLRIDGGNICVRRFSLRRCYVTKTLLLSLPQYVTLVDVLNFDRFISPATCWTCHHKAVMVFFSLLDPSVGERSASLFKADVCHYVLLEAVFLLGSLNKQLHFATVSTLILLLFVLNL